MRKNVIQSRFRSKTAFTLIELLVVVLIIGVLAAVAVPQYQLAVYKSRFATVMTNVRSMTMAQEAFYLTNGRYASDEETSDGALDILKPISDSKQWFHSGNEFSSARIYDGKGNGIAQYSMYYKNQSREVMKKFAGKIMCMSYAPNQQLGNKICESFGGQLEKNTCSASPSVGSLCGQYKISDYY